MTEPLVKPPELLEEHVFPKMDGPIRYFPLLEGRLKDLIQSVKAQRLEGLVAKRRDSRSGRISPEKSRQMGVHMTQVQPQTVPQAAQRACLATTNGAYLSQVHTQ
jgi:hypothetical protein